MTISSEDPDQESALLVSVVIMRTQHLRITLRESGSDAISIIVNSNPRIRYIFFATDA